MTIPDSLHVMLILRALPSTYEVMQRTILVNVQDYKLLTSADMRSPLISEELCTSSTIAFTEGESFLSSLCFPFDLFPFSLAFWASSLERPCCFLQQSHSQWPELVHQLQESVLVAFLAGIMVFMPIVVP